MADTLTWLHLSDLHMRRDALDDLRVVLDALWCDLPEQIAELGGQLDFIAFTGDIAFSGKAEEYGLAERHFFQPLLEFTNLLPTQLFVVPGNHDIDRDAANVINPDIPYSLKNRSQVTQLLSDDVKRQVFFQPMAEYARFIKRFFGEFREHEMLRDPLYSYVQLFPKEQPLVALVGLNSAWLSGFTKDARGNVIDRGNLLIGDKQIGDALRETKKIPMRIVLMHHPLSWLKEFDALDVKGWLQPDCDFVLQGHLHVPNFEREQALDRETINIPAGTIYKGREWLNGYNLVQINLDTEQGNIFFRRYSEQRHEWVADVQSTGKADGTFEFSLPKRLRRSRQRIKDTATPIPVISPSPVTRVLHDIKPRWLRLGRERETQILDAFIEQDSKNHLWVWGEEGCGSEEFLIVVLALLRLRNIDFIYFDAKDAFFGTPLDQDYFLSRLEQWAGTILQASSDRLSEHIDQRLKRLLARAENQLEKNDRRLVLIFANYHLLPRTIKEWTWITLWGRMLEPLKKLKTLGIFAGEGTTVPYPTIGHESIQLAGFTVQDIENFLRTSPFVNSREIPDLAREIHTHPSEGFLASPHRVYQNLMVKVFEIESRERSG